MKRDIEDSLLVWKQQEGRLPLLLRGARQVGKSYVVEKFGQFYFDQLVTLNFELQPELIACFDSLEPHKIIGAITLLTGRAIEPGKTLLFLDEIQDCPNAIRALRYFKEKLPALHVIGAGSLLEFAINEADFRMPVGRVQSFYLKPLSFKEYLSAAGFLQLRQFLEEISLETVVPESVHQQLLKLIKEYMVLGGMPAVLQQYFATRDIAQCQIIQTELLNTYRRDFGKYASRADHKYVRRLFEKAPGLVAQHFKYVKVDPQMRSRNIKDALEMLNQAGLIYLVYATSASSLPLVSLINEKKFKLLILDIGLSTRSTRLEADLLLAEDILLINRGALAEQFVGQELLAYALPAEEANAYFWCREQRSSMAEVDFIMTVGSSIIPIEVKAGATGHLKSLKLFMEEKHSPLGIRISQLPLKLEGSILSLPLYMVSEITRLIGCATNLVSLAR